jgi:hypothetical protein
VTRVNVGISPSELPKSLLLAEHREIKRIPNMVRTGRAKLRGIPSKFTLGEGHVKFFYNKLGYIKTRYHQIYHRCLELKCNVQYYGDSFNGIPDNLMGEYEETPEDRELLIERIHFNGFKLVSE